MFTMLRKRVCQITFGNDIILLIIVKIVMAPPKRF